MTQPYPYPPFPGNPPSRRFGRGFFSWILFAGLALILIWLVSHHDVSRQTIPLSEFRSRLISNNVSEVILDGDEVTGMMKTEAGATVGFRTELPTGTSSNWMFTEWLLQNSGNATVTVNNSSSILTNVLLPLVPWLLIFGFIWFFVFRRIRNLKQRFSDVRFG
jgi:cell division protease FtsH